MCLTPIAFHFQVQRDDDTSKLCSECFRKVIEFSGFRESCAQRNINYVLRKLGNSMHNVVNHANGNEGRPSVSVEIISLLETESENENDVDTPHPSPQSAPVPEQVNDNQQTGVNLIFKCHVCQIMFGSSERLMAHRQQLHAPRSKPAYECYLCKLPFDSKSSLMRHMRNVQHGAEYKCPKPMCSIRFSRIDLLKRHLMSPHREETKFCCKYCTLTFVRKSLLAHHLASKHGNKSHGRLKSYKCSFASCSRSFTTQANLNRHINCIHTKQDVFKCNKCPKRFYRQDYWKVHVAEGHNWILLATCRCSSFQTLHCHIQIHFFRLRLRNSSYLYHHIPCVCKPTTIETVKYLSISIKIF